MGNNTIMMYLSAFLQWADSRQYLCIFAIHTISLLAQLVDTRATVGTANQMWDFHSLSLTSWDARALAIFCKKVANRETFYLQY